MGHAKQAMIAADALSLNVYRPDKQVCAECFKDDALKRIVAKYAKGHECEYCGYSADHPISTPLDVITEHMATCINLVYCDVDDTQPYDPEEGGYFCGETYDNIEVLLEVIGFDVSNDTLRDDIHGSFMEKVWSEIDWQILDPAQRLLNGWKTFSHAIKHQQRFTFWSMNGPGTDPSHQHHPDYLAVGETLKQVTDAIREAGVLSELPVNTSLWRVRVHKESDNISKDSDLAAPPIKCAIQPNRMSPAGISMFYGSEDYETAVAETLDRDRATDKLVTRGLFHPVRSLNILDLSDLPDIPSFFDIDAFDVRHVLVFLRDFAEEVSKAISRDGCEDIDYVPTQAFSEYVRYQMTNENARPVDGIRYRSSKNDGKCYVVFCDHDQCIEQENRDGPAQLLRFDKTSLKSDPAKNVPIAKHEVEKTAGLPIDDFLRSTRRNQKDK